MEAATPLPFSIVAGGPIYRFARLFALARGPHRLLMLGTFFALVTWGPLFVLSAVQGHLMGNVTIPFLADVSSHARFLVALPLLFAAEGWIDPRLAGFVRQILDSRLVLRPSAPPLSRPFRRWPGCATHGWSKRSLSSSWRRLQQPSTSMST